MRNPGLLDIASTVAVGIIRAARCSSAVDARMVLRNALLDALDVVDSNEEELRERRGEYELRDEQRDEQAVIEAAKAWAAPRGNGAASHTPEARRLCAAVDRLTGEDGAGR